MLAKRVIPSLDVHDGEVTRGVQSGVAEKGGLRNMGNPVDHAVGLSEAGSASPAVQEMDALVASKLSVKEASTIINRSPE